MKAVYKLLRFAPVFLAVLAADVAFSQATSDNSTLALQVSPAKLAVGSLSYRALGVAGSKAQGPSTFAPPGDSGDYIPTIGEPGFYPADLSNPQHEPTVITTSHHPIYVDGEPRTWGDVGTFLTDLGKSDFIHVLDQYTGATSNNRYTLGTSFTAAYPIPANHTLLISDILSLVHAAAWVKGSGLGHLYHVFLPKGADMCLTATQCYSPDNPTLFVFCAFHGTATFTDSVGTVIFSVEPYQDVNGCSVPPAGTANNQLIDSTDTVLSHEVFESLSDPGLNAWWVQAFTFANGNEIGDLCTRAGQFKGHFYWDYGRVYLNGNPYTIQPEYSNQVHGCTYSQ